MPERVAALNLEPSYPAWKAAAIAALKKLHWSAVASTRDGLWTRLYVQGFSPEEAAEVADQTYLSTQPPEWLTNGW